MPKKQAAKKPAKRSVKKVPRKKPAAKKSAKGAKPAPPPGQDIGRVVAFFRIPVVAVIKLKRGKLTVGDRIWIKGHTTDVKLTVGSMQIDHQPVETISKGAEAGLKLPARARRGDRVYLLD